MEKWRRLTIIGCAASFLVCLVLPLAPYFLRVWSLKRARERWAHTGGQSYTIVVTQACFCPYAGEYRLTVHNGHVTAVEPLLNPFGAQIGDSALSPMPPRLSDLDHLTVEAAFAEAERALRASWLTPWFNQRNVEYDSTYGYVTRFEADENGLLSRWFNAVSDSHYLYTARDLLMMGP